MAVERGVLEESYPNPAWPDAPPLGIVMRLEPEDRRFWDAQFRSYFDNEGSRLAGRVRRGIRDQMWDWPALQEQYAAWKDEQGRDSRMLISTGEYLGAITHRPIPYGFEVSVRPGTHQEAEVEYRVLGTWLEYGTSRMPGRPHFWPAIEAWRAEELPAFLARLGRHMARRIRHRLREMGASAAYGMARTALS